MEKIRDKLISPFFLVKNEDDSYSLRKESKIITRNSTLDYNLKLILQLKELGKSEYNSLDEYINERLEYKKKLIEFKQKVIDGDNNQRPTY